MDRYILEIWEGVEPILKGPYAGERNRIRAARRRRAKDAQGDNGLFRINVSRTHTGNRVEVESFYGYEMEPK
jgi:hypothetical protein